MTETAGSASPTPPAKPAGPATTVFEAPQRAVASPTGDAVPAEMTGRAAPTSKLATAGQGADGSDARPTAKPFRSHAASTPNAPTVPAAATASAGHSTARCTEKTRSAGQAVVAALSTETSLFAPTEVSAFASPAHAGGSPAVSARAAPTSPAKPARLWLLAPSAGEKTASVAAGTATGRATAPPAAPAPAAFGVGSAWRQATPATPPAEAETCTAVAKPARTTSSRCRPTEAGH